MYANVLRVAPVQMGVYELQLRCHSRRSDETLWRRLPLHVRT